ncbi:MAG: CDP-alcohol phosphatidyltransferase family protein [Oscillospiraceae bacterium]|nr:CDP-alcohol phosphatidyltransferase family protein [Oscillospiraceae bacterium]
MENNLVKNLNIPNLLSIFRILLIPVFIVFYMMADSTQRIYYAYAAGAIVISGLSDLFDGVIARKYNQITNLGKILDPLADKLTQVAVVICIAIKMQSVVLAATLMFFVVKEFLMLLGGLLILRRNITIQGSKWYGKVATAVFYVVMAAISLFDNISTTTALIMVLVAALFMLFAFLQYIREFFKIMDKNKTVEKQI